MTKRDILLVFIALTLFGVSFLFFNLKNDVKGSTALIVYKEEVLAKLDLSKDSEYGFGISKKGFKPIFLTKEKFNKEDYASYNMISVKKGTIGVVEASCPDGLCSRMRPISKASEVIVCLPHKFYIKLPSGEEGGLDAISE